jgi:hypothetical protein
MSATQLACPDPEHTGSRVVRNGVYGPLGRQRYRCHPAGGVPHTFSAHPELAGDGVGDRTGPGRLRSYRHDVAEIAAALISIGRGSSYRQAAIRASAGAQINGQLVADWVRVFGPIVSAVDSPRRWPALLSVGSFTIRQERDGGRLRLQMAVGSNAAGTPHRLWDARITRGGGHDEWKVFFGRRHGIPEVLVVERGSEEAAVALQTWARRPPVLVEARRRLRPDVEAHGRPDVSDGGLVLDDQDVEKLVREFAEHRGALVRRLAARQAHFRSHDQMDRLLDLIRIDLNGEADLGEYAERIMVEGTARPL